MLLLALQFFFIFFYEGVNGFWKIGICVVQTGQTVAIKKIRLGKQKEGVNFTALREIKLLKELKSPHIIELIDAFPHKGNLHLVFEFMETDLETVIRNTNIFLSPADIKSYMQMTLKGLAFCHKKWVLHRSFPFLFLFHSWKHECLLECISNISLYFTGIWNQITCW